MLSTCGKGHGQAGLERMEEKSTFDKQDCDKLLLLFLLSIVVLLHCSFEVCLWVKKGKMPMLIDLYNS